MPAIVAQPDVAAPRARWVLWAGYVLTALPTLMLLFSASMKFSRPPQVVDIFVGKLGYPLETLTVIAVLEILCAVLYAIPQTAVLGAVLMTGYLGGAIATHVRVGDPWVSPLVVALVAWAGLYLREQRLRALLPLRRAR